MKFTKQKQQNRLLIGNLNINSICSKFDQTKCLIKGKVDNLTITENKSDSSFTITQFLIYGYSKPFRFDRNRNAVGVLLYVREDIVSREVKSENLSIDINKIFIELNLRKVKWLFFSTHHPPSQSEDYYFSRVSNCLDAFSPTYDRFLLVGNFNADYSKETLFNFLQKHNAANILKDKTRFKIVLKLSKCNCLFNRSIRF